MRQQLAERRQDPTDRRRVHVHLTDAGRRVLAEAYEAKRSRTLDILATFSADERRHLIRLLETYLERVGDRLSGAGRKKPRASR